MNTQKAKLIGSRQALKAVCIGLLIAQLIMTWLSSHNGIVNGFLWFVDFNYKLNIIIGIIIMLLSGYFLSQKAGIDILIKKKNYVWTGFKYSFLVLFITAVLSSLTGFFQEGIHNLGTTDEPFTDYIFKPLYWIMAFGILPVLIVGFWFGRLIKKRDVNSNVL